jgi:hypothetical protein
MLTFSQANPDHIKCVDSCLDGNEPEKYPPITVEDYVKNKYRSVYDRASVYKGYVSDTKHSETPWIRS